MGKKIFLHAGDAADLGGGGGGILTFVRGVHAGNFPPTLECMYYHNSLTVCPDVKLHRKNSCQKL